MAVSNINSVLFTGVSAIDGITRSTLSAVGGQTITAGGGTVAFDANTVGSYSGNGTQTVSYTTGGSNRYIFIGTISDRAPAAVPTYNGVNTTLLGTVTLSALVAVSLKLYGLVNPASGTNNVAVDWSGGAPTSTIAFIGSFKDVSQGTPLGTVVTNSIDAQSQAFSDASLSLSSGQAAYALMATYNRTMTCPSLTLLDTSNPISAQCGAHGYKITTGTEACQFDWSGNQIWGEISVPVLPA